MRNYKKLFNKNIDNDSKWLFTGRIHWYAGLIGYFPTYSLRRPYTAAQFASVH